MPLFFGKNDRKNFFSVLFYQSLFEKNNWPCTVTDCYFDPVSDMVNLHITSSLLTE